MQPIPPESEDYNPYAPPAMEESCLAPTTAVVGAWREGGQLVMHRDYILPDICARTLQPADSYYHLNTNFWHTSRVRIPVSGVWKRGRWFRFFLYILLTFMVPFIGLSLISWLPFSTLRTVGALVSVGGAALCFLLANDQFWPFSWARTRGPYIAISGFSHAYLQRLPEWPGINKLQEPVEM